MTNFSLTLTRSFDQIRISGDVLCHGISEVKVLHYLIREKYRHQCHPKRMILGRNLKTPIATAWYLSGTPDLDNPDFLINRVLYFKYAESDPWWRKAWIDMNGYDHD